MYGIVKDEVEVEVGLQKIAAVIGVAVVASSRQGVEYLLASQVASIHPVSSLNLIITIIE
jgi:hypothetical protein